VADTSSSVPSQKLDATKKYKAITEKPSESPHVTPIFILCIIIDVTHATKAIAISPVTCDMKSLV
jgi:hypothetical protein